LHADLLALPDVAPPRPTRRAGSILAALTALTLVLHLVGLDWHLSHHAQAGEKVLWLQVRIARGHEVMPSEVVFARSHTPLLGRVANLIVPEPARELPHDLARCAKPRSASSSTSAC